MAKFKAGTPMHAESGSIGIFSRSLAHAIRQVNYVKKPKYIKKEINKSKKLTDQDVIDARSAFNNGGVTIHDLAEKYKVQYQTMYNILHYITRSKVIEKSKKL